MHSAPYTNTRKTPRCAPTARYTVANPPSAIPIEPTASQLSRPAPSPRTRRCYIFETFADASELPRNDLLFDLQMSRTARCGGGRHLPERKRVRARMRGRGESCMFDGRHVHMSPQGRGTSFIPLLSCTFLRLSARRARRPARRRAFCQVRCTLSSISFCLDTITR